MRFYQAAQLAETERNTKYTEEWRLPKPSAVGVVSPRRQKESLQQLPIKDLLRLSLKTLTVAFVAASLIQGYVTLKNFDVKQISLDNQTQVR